MAGIRLSSTFVFPAYTCAFRTVTQAGVEVLAPVRLYTAEALKDTAAGTGLLMDGFPDVSYEAIRKEDAVNLQQRLLWQHLGYRVKISFELSFVAADLTSTTYGTDILSQLWDAGNRGETFGALQFTIWSQPVTLPGVGVTTPIWRGVRPDSPLHLIPVVEGKSVGGFRMPVELTVVDLVTALPNYARRLW